MQVLGELTHRGPVVDVDVHDVRAVGRAERDHRHAAAAQVIGERILRRAAAEEDAPVDRRPREPLDRLIGLVEGLGDEEHAGRDVVEHGGEPVEHAHRVGVVEGVEEFMPLLSPCPNGCAGRPVIRRWRASSAPAR